MAKDKVLDHYREQLKNDEQALKDSEAGTANGAPNPKSVPMLRLSIAKLKRMISAHEKHAKHG
jgi:hypothetical protein